MTAWRLGAGALTGLAGIVGTGAAAWAAPGQPEPWQLGFQDMVSPVGRDGGWFHDVLMMPIITVITLFVLALLLVCMTKFSAKNNPVPSKTSHNTLIEVLWTVVPIVILVIIAIPSFRLLYYTDVIPEADLTIKATGSQWYWTYAYPDHGNFEFDSIMKTDDELEDGDLRLLSTDTKVVVPVNKTVRVQVASNDVLHAWAIPSFFVKIDAVPGRLNETWFKAEQEGVYYGQCSELCGKLHGFMPIEVHVVSEAAFAEWVKKAQAEYAGSPVIAPAADGVQTAFRADAGGRQLK